MKKALNIIYAVLIIICVFAASGLYSVTLGKHPDGDCLNPRHMLSTSGK